MSGDAPGQRRSALTDLHLPSMFRAPQEATGAAHQVREEGHASGTRPPRAQPGATLRATHGAQARARRHYRRSEEHTSELQSPCNLVCRLLLEKKKKKNTKHKLTKKLRRQ